MECYSSVNKKAKFSRVLSAYTRLMEWGDRCEVVLVILYIDNPFWKKSDIYVIWKEKHSAANSKKLQSVIKFYVNWNCISK